LVRPRGGRAGPKLRDIFAAAAPFPLGPWRARARRAARRFGTTRKTVRKWLARHLQGQGLGGRGAVLFYRPHCGAGMDGMSPIEKLRSEGLELKDSFALMPPVMLDKVASQIVAQGGYHVQARYTRGPWKADAPVVLR